MTGGATQATRATACVKLAMQKSRRPTSLPTAGSAEEQRVGVLGIGTHAVVVGRHDGRNRAPIVNKLLLLCANGWIIVDGCDFQLDMQPTIPTVVASFVDPTRSRRIEDVSLAMMTYSRTTDGRTKDR